MGWLGDLLFKNSGPKDPVRGQAEVVACGAHHGRGVYEICRMQLVIQGEGVPAAPLEHAGLVHRDKWPEVGMTLPVTIDRANPRNFQIEWDEVRGVRERAAQRAEAIAAMRRGEPAPWAEAHGGTDPSKLTPEQRAKLQRLGIDPIALTAARGFGPRMGSLDDDA